MSIEHESKFVANKIADKVFEDRTGHGGREEVSYRQMDREDLVGYLQVAYQAGADRVAPDPQVLRALRAELHQYRGGHQREVQADVAKLTTVTARMLLQTLRGLKNDVSRARRAPRTM